VSWRIATTEGGCKVTVTDSEPERSEQAASMLRKGWLDFSRRLRDYFVKGGSTRYDWRHDFDGSIEIPASLTQVWARLSEKSAQSRWLPVGIAGLGPNASIIVNDGDEPSSVRVSDVAFNPPFSIDLELANDEWLNTTRARLELSARRHDTILSVSHNGWRAISRNEAYQKQQRKRFCEFWIAALERARGLAS
jgi:hypothetical protein